MGGGPAPPAEGGTPDEAAGGSTGGSARPARGTETGPEVDPTTGSVRGSVLRLAGPAVAAALLQTLFNITDTFWVGRELGPAALAGVSTGGFAVWAVLALAELAAVGLTAVASRRHGQGRRAAAAAAGYHASVLAMGLALAVGVAGLATLDLLFGIMGTPPEVTREGAGYLSVYLGGVPIVFAYFVMDAAFRASGDTRTPFRLLALAVLLNLAADPLLILGVGPLPRLEIRGAALATLVTRGLACAVGYHLLVRRGLLRREAPSLPGLAKMARIGAPVAAGGAVFSLVYVLLTRFTSEFGTSALAALGVGHKVESLSYMACVGFGVAAGTSVGQNLGAEEGGRARLSGRAATVYAVALTALVGMAFLLVPETIMGFFTDSAAVVRDGESYLRIVAAAQVFMAVHIVLESAMSGAGYTVLPMTVTMALTLARLPLAAVMGPLVGLAGIWWTISGTTMARGVAMAWIWRTGRWRAREV